jgi:cyanate permease
VTETTAGYIFMCNALAFAVFSNFIGYLADKYKHHLYLFMVLGNVIVIVGILILDPSPILGSLLKKYVIYFCIAVLSLLCLPSYMKTWPSSNIMQG